MKVRLLCAVDIKLELVQLTVAVEVVSGNKSVMVVSLVSSYSSLLFAA